METPINANNESQFQYIYNIVRGQGEPYYMPDGSPIYNSIIYLTMPFEAMDIFEERYNSGKIPCHYKYEDYITDKDLQATINGLKLDPDAFWLLIMFLFDYAYSICLSGFTIKDSSQRTIEKLLKLMSDDEDSEMKLSINTLKGKLDISDSRTISILMNWIQQGYDRDEEAIKGYTVEDFKDIFNPKEESISVLIWYFASLLKYFFEINPQFSGRAKKGAGVSLNKNLLISKLIYHTRLSTNRNFLDDPESLKGFFKQYRGKTLSGKSSIYPTC
ncbi:MAG: hypothetical protein NC212_10880 [Staphylococcus sp.]|nr:hypothetical protein [Staphylococcus sp.]